MPFGRRSYRKRYKNRSYSARSFVDRPRTLGTILPERVTIRAPWAIKVNVASLADINARSLAVYNLSRAAPDISTTEYTGFHELLLFYSKATWIKAEWHIHVTNMGGNDLTQGLMLYAHLDDTSIDYLNNSVSRRVMAQPHVLRRANHIVNVNCNNRQGTTYMSGSVNHMKFARNHGKDPVVDNTADLIGPAANEIYLHLGQYPITVGVPTTSTLAIQVKINMTMVLSERANLLIT